MLGSFDSYLKSVGGLRTFMNDPIAVLVELLLIGLSVNWFMGVLHGTRGTRPLRGMLTLLIVGTLGVNALAAQFKWPRLALLSGYFVIGLAFISLIAFQPELRRAVIRAGDVRFLRRGTRQSKVITALVQAARYLSKNRYGALIAIQRAVDLRGWAEKGTLINADVSANLLSTIFFPNSPLHDLGVVIAGERVVAANCQFPVVESDEVGTSVGSRHLAAVGMSYESDALVLVVSEETGTISLADKGRLTRFLSIDDLAEELATRMAGKTPGERRQDRPPLTHGIWRAVRRLLVVIPLTLVIWMAANQWTQTDSPWIAVQLDIRVNDPQRVVDVKSPKSRLFQVVFRGTAREVDALRDFTSTSPLGVDWDPEQYRVGADQSNQWSATQVLNSLPQIRARGLMVKEVVPENLEFAVQDLVTLNVGLRASTGTARVENVQFTPDQVQVTLRRGDAEHLLAAERVIAISLEDRLRGAPVNQALTFRGVPVPDKIKDLSLINRSPKEVNVTLEVVAQRITRRLSPIPVWLEVSPEVLDRYDVVRVDPQEWLVEVEVAGDESKVKALDPQKVRAYVTVPNDVSSLPPTYRPEVELALPEGVTAVRKPTVQLRIIPKGTPASP